MPFFCQLSLPIHLYLSPPSVAVSKQCQSAYSGCSFLVSVLALGVRAAAHLLWWFLFSLLYCALLLWQRCCIFFSSYCYGCCRLLLRLLVVFLMLILVHLRFPLGVLRLAALLGFPCWLLFSEWRTVREALLFFLCLHGCRRFIGVRGVGSFFRAFGVFRKWVPSPSGPFPAVLCPSIGRPGGTGGGETGL